MVRTERSPKLDKGTIRRRNLRMNGDHRNYYITKIGQDIEKNTRDQRRLGEKGEALGIEHESENWSYY